MSSMHGLSDKEIKEGCKLPLRNTVSIFEPAQVWLKRNKAMLDCAHSKGDYLFLNAGDLTYVVGKNHDTAAKEYATRFGPTPTEGREILGLQL